MTSADTMPMIPPATPPMTVPATARAATPTIPVAPVTPVAVDAGRLWAGGLATAAVAALVALVGALVVRAVLQVGLAAPHAVTAFDGPATGLLCAVAAAAALAATGLAHLLLLSTPRPLAYLGWITGLATAAAAVLPFLGGAALATAAALAAVHLVIGLAIGSLVAGAAAASTRGHRRPAFEIE